MVASIIAMAVAVAFWSLLANWFERMRISAPMVVVGVGVVVGVASRHSVGDTLNTEIALHTAEIILAILLFVDAAEVRGGLLGRNPGAALRMLLVALPLSLAAAMGLGAWLLPGHSWAVLLVIACVVVPIDFAPATALLRDRRIPVRVRDLLNVESGYNDGIVSPIILFALILAVDNAGETGPWKALMSAGPSALKAIGVGVGVGLLLSVLVELAERHQLMNAHSKRLILVAAPLLTFGVSVAIGGNGFVASFVCGFIFQYMRRRTHESQRDLELIDDVGFLLTVVMWFVFGSAAVLALWDGLSWQLAVFCLATLTVVRIIPVVIAMTGTRFTWIEQLLLGWLGPRGTTSIVFGLLAFNQMRDEDSLLVLTAMVVTVLGSVILHGVGTPLTVGAYRMKVKRKTARQAVSASAHGADGRDGEGSQHGKNAADQE